MTDRRVAKEPSLRHFDWRFLLPVPPEGAFQHLVLLGGEPSIAKRIHELEVAQRVSRTIPSAATVDALVVLKDGAPLLERAIQCLAPSAVVYCEVDRLLRFNWMTTPARIKRTLELSGVTVTGTYAIRPSFQSREVYLPIDIPHVLRWYITTLYVSRTPNQRLLEFGLKLLTGLNHRRFASLAPFFALTGVKGFPQDVRPMILQSGLTGEEHQRLQARPVLLTPGEDGGNRVTMLVFPSGSVQPTMVVKVPKLPEFNGRTENEQQTLAMIRDRVDVDMLSSLPKPLGCHSFGALVVSRESYMPGCSLARISGSWGKSTRQKLDSLRLAANWLGNFHYKAEVARPLWTPTLAAQWVEAPLQQYQHLFGATASELQLFDYTYQRSSELAGLPFPLVWQHRDFNIWNIFQCERAINVIDWEGGQTGPGVCDLLHFVTHWNEAARHLTTPKSILRGFQSLFCQQPKDKIYRTIHSVIAQYMQHFGVDRRFLPLLLVYTWVELALRRFDQQQTMGRTKIEPRVDNRFVAYVGVLAQNAQQLFGGPPNDGSSPSTAFTTSCSVSTTA